MWMFQLIRTMSKTCSSSLSTSICVRQKPGPVLELLLFSLIQSPHTTLQISDLSMYIPTVLSEFNYLQFSPVIPKKVSKALVRTVIFSPLSSLQEVRMTFLNCKSGKFLCLKPTAWGRFFQPVSPLPTSARPHPPHISALCYPVAKCSLFLLVFKCFFFSAYKQTLSRLSTWLTNTKLSHS